MIVHAVSLLDDLDKELNTYAMRVKEWYGWHFPELAKILPDNLSYARVIVTLGMRGNAVDADLSEILPHEIETAVKAAADISMGTEINDEDLENIRLLAEQVISYSEYRKQLAEYLENRMRAISPNMTELVGALVGARLIAHAGSLISLAKNPGSTIQILGAEKALFRALKTKHATPKYGLIYHASLVGQASGPNKGKMARQLASKVALGVRTDALAEFEDDADDETRANLGIRSRVKLENNLRVLEGKPLAKGTSLGPNGMPLGAPSKWDIKEARKYNIDADGLVADLPKKLLIEEVADEEKSDEEMEDAAPSKKEKKDKKEKKEKSKKSKDTTEAATPAKKTEVTEKDYERLAKAAGMSVAKFARRFERGQIKVQSDGSLEILNKKDFEEEAETPVKAKSSKRKHAEEEAEATPVKEEKPKKKKKKSSKE
jgi:nucleolar protein 58